MPITHLGTPPHGYTLVYVQHDHANAYTTHFTLHTTPKAIHASIKTSRLNPTTRCSNQLNKLSYWDRQTLRPTRGYEPNTCWRL